ncbi:MAG TPA: cyclohexanone monooxygenase, partial [Pseudomonadales bacterium]|nr:cyclohexanone monooxygenase [Pseudomonadales bacterium]
WDIGGAHFIGVLGDTVITPETNELVADFVRSKIRETVRDPETAEALCPTSHPIGTKRICVDSGYYETYNRDNVKLVDIKRHPIERITENAIVTSDDEYEIDTLVLATGFDAMTGALLRMDVHGSNGVSLEDKWAEGPKTYLGLQVAGFPNLYTITGPGSPSVLSNMIVSIEQHVDWIADCLSWMRENGYERMEPSLEAEEGWVGHVNEVAASTLFPKAGSWYMGANIPGKPRVFMPYAAGVGPYRDVCDDVAANDYRGFVFA